MKKIISFVVAFTVILGISATSFAVSDPADITPAQGYSFSDVPEGAWYAEALQAVVERGWMKGYGDGRFGPEDVVNADQVAQVIYNIAPESLTSTYFDWQGISNGYWAFSVAAWVKKENIMDNFYGNSTVEGFARPCRRDECVSAFGRMARGYGFEDLSYQEAKALNIPDCSDITKSYQRNVQLAYHIGLVQGAGGGYFYPQNTLTRAELVQILANFMKLIEGKEFNKDLMGSYHFDPEKEKYIGWNHVMDDENHYYGEFEGWHYIALTHEYIPDDSIPKAVGHGVGEHW